MKTLQQAIDELKSKADKWARNTLDSTVIYRCKWYAGLGVCVEVKAHGDYESWISVKFFPAA